MQGIKPNPRALAPRHPCSVLTQSKGSVLPAVLVFLPAVLLLAALLTPLLQHAASACAQWLQIQQWDQSGWGSWLSGEIRRASPSRYFNRAVLIACALTLPLLWRRLRIESLPTWGRIGPGGKQLLVGWLLAAGLLLALGASLTALGVYQMRPRPGWQVWPNALLAGLCVALLEEWLLRGILLDSLRRKIGVRAALWVSSLFFSLLHFLKPPADWKPADPQAWGIGFEVLAQIGSNLMQPQVLFAEFTTLTMVGLVLARARVTSGSLWPCIGLHAGWVFGLKWFSALTLMSQPQLPWIGTQLKVGLLPLLTIAMTGWLHERLVLRARRQPR